VSQLLVVPGFIVSAFQTSRSDNRVTFWFLPTLFLLRTLYLPILGHMRTPALLSITFVTWLLFLLTQTGSSVSDGSAAKVADYMSSALIYLPHFMVGYVFKRHQLFQRYVQARAPGSRAAFLTPSPSFLSCL
jgi:hypothetical protein